MPNKIQRRPLRSQFISIPQYPKLLLDVNVKDLTKSSSKDNIIKDYTFDVSHIEIPPSPSGILDEHPKPSENPNSLKKFFEFLASIAGFIVALLWLGGRFYAAGYFSSLNVPLYMLNFSIWEYGEIYGVIFFLFLLLLIKENIILIAIALIIGTLIGLISIIIFPKQKLDKLLINLKKFLTNWVWLAWVALALFLSLNFANEVGKRNGFQVAVSDSSAVDITFNESVFLDNSITSVDVGKTTNTNLSQVYGLRLITYNSGKYYLYKDVDENTCKPKRVYVIDETKISSIYLYKADPFDIPSCANLLKSPIGLKPMPTIVPVPSPTP